MQDSLVSQGIDLMLFGMGSVSVFLSVLVLVTIAMSKLVSRYFPDPVEADLLLQKREVKPILQAVDTSTLTIIQSAIDQHRARR